MVNVIQFLYFNYNSREFSYFLLNLNNWGNKENKEDWIALIPLCPPGIIVNKNITVVILSAKSKIKEKIYPWNIGKNTPQIINKIWTSVILNLLPSLKKPKNLLLP